jgi:hypothetical protein
VSETGAVLETAERTMWLALWAAAMGSSEGSSGRFSFHCVVVVALLLLLLLLALTTFSPTMNAVVLKEKWFAFSSCCLFAVSLEKVKKP